jgi:hypothetical protein
VADLEAALMGTSKMRFGKNSQHNEVLADAFKKKLDAQEKAAKQRALDNDTTATMSLKLMLEVWNNELLKQVWRTTPFWLTVACFAIGFFLGGGASSEHARAAWDGVLMGGLNFVTIFFLTWYLGKMWDRRTTVRTAVDDVTGCMQAIPMLARTTDMSFAHQVQLWRYISCAIVTSINATCGVKYTDEFNYAENMINMHHLMTPQESQVLEVSERAKRAQRSLLVMCRKLTHLLSRAQIWRPNSTYCRLEFMVQAMNVLASARRNDQLSDVLEVDLRQNILKLRGLLGGIGYLIEAEPPFGTRQMVGFVVLLYVRGRSGGRKSARKCHVRSLATWVAPFSLHPGTTCSTRSPGAWPPTKPSRSRPSSRPSTSSSQTRAAATSPGRSSAACARAP